MTTAVQNFGWLISEFARTADGVTAAVAVSSDGLLMAASETLDRDSADHLAAVVSGITSLAQNAATAHGFHGMKLVMIEMFGGFLMVGRIRDGSCLGVLAAEGCDVGLVGYEMAVLADRVGELLTPQLVRELNAAPLSPGHLQHAPHV
ncbi:roadblock/LC7 domain-containing protein [Streptomyces sp. NPDC050625]|uniref:roadblock/LC7 domain-containing protein n=1 Tax=Streptomyces sp. NPDC050625 TaxID=3154629 RepID=UPI003434DA78